MHTQTRVHGQTKVDAGRRRLLLGAGGLALIAACGRESALAAPPAGGNAEKAFVDSPFRKITDEEWRRRLPELSYHVLRHEYTERPGTSPLLDEHRAGKWACLGCGLEMFDSSAKFDSGTGWPSFYQALEGRVATKIDADGYRTEYHCPQCLGHHGHLFNDGPRPTGLRYCNNGAALVFKPA